MKNRKEIILSLLPQIQNKQKKSKLEQNNP